MKPKFYKTDARHACPTLRVEGKTGIADPCYIIPNPKWGEFLKSYYAALGPDGNRPRSRAVFIFCGVPFRVKDTGGDGMFQNVAVDSGKIAEFPIDEALEKFSFEMIPASKEIL